MEITQFEVGDIISLQSRIHSTNTPFTRKYKILSMYSGNFIQSVMCIATHPDDPTRKVGQIVTYNIGRSAYIPFVKIKHGKSHRLTKIFS